MKKRMVCLLLFLGLLCTGCQSGGALSDGEETTSPQETTSPPAETTTSSLTHQDIVPVKAETCEMRAFRNGTLRRVLGMPLPKSWEFQKDLSLGWEIVRNGTRIGTMGTDNFETEGWVLVQSQSLERSGVRLEICIERNDTTAPTAFRYRLEMEYDHLDQILHSTMTVDYAEMAEFTLTKIKGNIGIVELSTDPALGTVPLPASRRSILIL
ncbi:MAG: hypothetical protein IJY42_01460, partial [Clostridia bacterium]|nr:hypothetical protein [Clostridia bacterium]